MVLKTRKIFQSNSSAQPIKSMEKIKSAVSIVIEFLKTFLGNHWKKLIGALAGTVTLGYIGYQRYFSSRFKNSTLRESETFDFIVVGSGSAGSVMASRLSENGKWSVLLIEAGSTDNVLEVKLPAAFAKLFKTSQDWNYWTVPQSGCNKRSMQWPRGKMLGGSSNMNAMIWQRGHRSDFDEMGKINPGWSYEECLPYFMKCEKNLGKNIDSEYHGSTGPMVITDQVGNHEISRQIVETFKNLGTPKTNDINGKLQEGVLLFQVNQKNGQRFSTADGYLSTDVLKRKNLKVSYDSLVVKVLIKDGKAYGIQYEKNGKSSIAVAAKEVILCGGSINTPQLLMLSGVGPSEHLKSHKIPVVMDLQGVGQNLQDHIFLTLCCATSLSSVHTEEGLGTVYQWATKGTGPLCSNLGEFGCFERTKGVDQNSPPNIEYIGGPLFFINHGGKVFPGDGATFGAVLIQPKSRGTLKLKSGNPKDHPLIDPNYFHHEEDMDIMVEAFKKCRKVSQSEPISKSIKKEVWPGAMTVTDDEIKRFIRQNAETLYHPTGTCKMGTNDDLDAVVDENCLVYGVKALRVVDASIFPTIISGHTQAATIMVAEKIADQMVKLYK